MTHRHTRRISSPRPWLSALLAASLLFGCGGGDAPPEPPPVVVVPAPPPPPPPPPVVVGPGELKSATLVNTIAAAEVAIALAQAGTKLPPVAPVYAVRSTRLTYLTRDGKGNEILASGLVSVPVKPAGARSPVISYQHGTIFKDADAPSNKVEPGEPPVVMASLGYIVVAADYVGYGASKGAQHPYLLSAPTASAVVDLITAALTWRYRNEVADNGQLFLLGYSEGGYATMATHRALQASSSPHLAQLIGSVPGAGPYHVGVTLDVLLDRVRDENPILGALINPGFLRHLGSTVRNEVRRALIRALVPDDADVGFQTDFIDNFLADDTAAIERDSNVHDWTPASPVRMYHGRDDQTVPYAVSVRTLQTMQQRGAAGVTLTDCDASPSSHNGCVPPYFGFMLAQLAGVVRDL